MSNVLFNNVCQGNVRFRLTSKEMACCWWDKVIFTSPDFAWYCKYICNNWKQYV